MSKPINHKCQLGTEANCKLLMHMNEASWNGTPDEVKDASGCGNHGQAFGGVTTIADGKFSRCGSFDGVGDYIDCGSGLLPSTGNFTLSMWQKTLSSAPDHRVLFGQSETNFVLYGTTIYGTAAGKIRLYVGTEVLIGPDIRDDTWHHIAVVRNGNDFTLYFDGIENATGSTSNAIGSSPTYIGTRTDNLTMGHNGAIDEVAIYDRALTAEEIYQYYHKQVGVHII